MSDPASAHLVDGHLAAGDGWLLARGRLVATGERVLLVSSDLVDVVDVADLRRRLAVAGSVAVAHLATPVGTQEAANGRLVVAFSSPDGPSLEALVAARGALAAGEVVTLVAPLAATLATLHARGLELADVTAATVWLAADGRPVLLPIGIRSRVAGEGDGARGDVAALAVMALALLDHASAGAEEVAAALQAAVDGGLDGDALGAAVLSCTRAAPIGAAVSVAPARAGRASSSRRRKPSSRRRRPRPRRHAAVGAAAVVGAVVVVGVVLGAIWGRHDGGALAAAPALPAASSPPIAAPRSAAIAAPSWPMVMTTLERLRAHAYATGNPASLSPVYAPGSPTGRIDVRQLQRLARQQQRAAGLQAFVEGVDVLARDGDRVTLLVTDALTAYDVVRRDGRVARHGTGRPDRTWRVTLVHIGSGWRIWSVSPAAGARSSGG